MMPTILVMLMTLKVLRWVVVEVDDAGDVNCNGKIANGCIHSDDGGGVHGNDITGVGDCVVDTGTIEPMIVAIFASIASITKSAEILAMSMRLMRMQWR